MKISNIFVFKIQKSKFLNFDAALPSYERLCLNKILHIKYQKKESGFIFLSLVLKFEIENRNHGFWTNVEKWNLWERSITSSRTCQQVIHNIYIHSTVSKDKLRNTFSVLDYLLFFELFGIFGTLECQIHDIHYFTKMLEVFCDFRKCVCLMMTRKKLGFSQFLRKNFSTFLTGK